ncbi:hypothetical protein AJ78_07311 [Emergomyces pasteurianus Ep9510]|uniref:Chromo domain-containing protein n=1 Tax=Emergomyces pasteurianus Ep9510 TaxID=1447872 RepID=A0A1J9P6I2_9EURO|nr:hypothetical protein AJ78_07311 [Emergomyces pasteurianus Ep9510]
MKVDRQAVKRLRVQYSWNATPAKQNKKTNQESPDSRELGIVESECKNCCAFELLSSGIESRVAAQRAALQLSEDESGGESIPFNDDETRERSANNAVGPLGEYEEDDDESGVEGEDVYVVERITGHEFAKNGTLLLQVKWKGYEDPADQTLEPEENLIGGAEDVLKEYFALIGGRPERPSKKRKSITGSTPTRDTVSSKKKPKKSRAAESNGTPETENNVADWVPKTKNWDSQVKSVDTIMRDPVTGNLFVYLNWNNDKKAKVSIQQCYEKCPQKMLQFYEQHLYVPIELPSPLNSTLTVYAGFSRMASEMALLLK